jgi:hypothetical protein
MALVSADTSAEIKNITLDSLARTPLRQAAGSLPASRDSAVPKRNKIQKSIKTKTL